MAGPLPPSGLIFFLVSRPARHRSLMATAGAWRHCAGHKPRQRVEEPAGRLFNESRLAILNGGHAALTDPTINLRPTRPGRGGEIVDWQEGLCKEQRRIVAHGSRLRPPRAESGLGRNWR